MKDIDYRAELEKLYDYEIEITSIADCRKVMAELNEQEDLLRKIRSNVKLDIRNVKSNYLNERANIRVKYDSDKTPGLMDSLKGPFGSNRIKDIKKLENERLKNLDYLNEVLVIAENLLEQTQEIENDLQKMIKEKLGNF